MAGFASAAGAFAFVLAAGFVAVLDCSSALTSAFAFVGTLVGVAFLGAALSVAIVSVAAGFAAFFVAGLAEALAFWAADATIALAAEAAVFLATGFLGAAAGGALSGFTSSGVVMAKTPCYWVCIIGIAKSAFI
jgi:hypothetical protein